MYSCFTSKGKREWQVYITTQKQEGQGTLLVEGRHVKVIAFYSSGTSECIWCMKQKCEHVHKARIQR